MGDIVIGRNGILNIGLYFLIEVEDDDGKGVVYLE